MSVVERREWLAPGPAEAFAGLLGVREPAPAEGLPLTWHWIYLLERPRTADLGPDGHPLVGIPAPPEPGRRRMWAGGSIDSLSPLLLEREATRRTRIRSQEDKHGRSGRLTFLAVEHEISQEGRVCVRERHDIVYRDAAAPASDTEPEPAGEEIPPGEGELEVEVTPVLLFRYSALTYNGHRIHYDRDYARDVEGYPGLITHGPLQACLMAEAARAAGLVAGLRQHGPLRFDYRLTSPLFDHQGLVAGAAAHHDEAVTTWARDRTGRRTAQGTITPLPGGAEARAT